MPRDRVVADSTTNPKTQTLQRVRHIFDVSKNEGFDLKHFSSEEECNEILS
jgi:hypothetical protein